MENQETVAAETATPTATKPRSRKPAKRKSTPHKAAVASPSVRVDNREPSEKIVFFTEADLDSRGNVKNTYPTYFNRKQRDDLEEEIRRYERMETEAKINPSLRAQVGDIREKIRSAKESLESMDKVRPEFRRNKDAIYKMTEELGGRIGESMFTRSDMMKGLADAHEEARRMSEPVIQLTPEIAGIAKANGIRMDRDRKVSRTDATRLWQMGREALGEGRNSEILRRD